MPRMRATEKAGKPECLRARLDEECLELGPATDRQRVMLRSLMGRVNSSAYPQPYLDEGPPGRFRLYVGEAAERIRTQRGIQ